MKLPTYFKDFLTNIRPTANQRSRMQSEHTKLRDLLANDEALSPLILSTFIQGSYRRMTATRPLDLEQCDVDVIVATNMHEDEFTPLEALEKFRPFLKEHYLGKHSIQGRSWGIKVDDDITLDLVPTSVPSEAQRNAIEWARAAHWSFPDEPNDITADSYDGLLLEVSGDDFDKFSRVAAGSEWKSHPLRIPDRQADLWEDTHPLEQIRWTWSKNSSTNGHYVNVVKSIKWWRKMKVAKPKHPKSYPLEHMIGDCCPEGVDSVAEGVTLALEKMESTYRPYIVAGRNPHLADRGVPSHDVLARVSQDDFSSFMDEVNSASKIAREALEADTVKESSELWRKLFGDEFPKAPDNDGDNDGSGGFSPRTENTQISGSRFAQ